NLATEIEPDPVMRNKIRVVFLENYDVSMAEKLMPAAEVSEQISTAGKEASGTGNMKMMINGAITIGTLDGANVEISEAVGRDNIFIFGKRADEIPEMWAKGYDPMTYYLENEVIKNAVDALDKGFNWHSSADIKYYLLKGEYGVADPYMCLADFDDYLKTHLELEKAYLDKDKWNKMSLINVAGAKVFPADRAIREYAEKIWNIKPVD
ncbi:MAG: glycogen/starch/alpha-glucan phosphorylase, partial [Anaerovoracaceae bacterium]